MNRWWYGGQCAVSVDGQTTVEWRVDLGAVKNIHHVIMQYIKGNSLLGILSFKVIDRISNLNIC